MASKRAQTDKVPDAEPVNLPEEKPAKDNANTGIDDRAPRAFRVTELAGPRLAGRRVKPDDKVQLTEAEARSYLAMGTHEEIDG